MGRLQKQRDDISEAGCTLARGRLLAAATGQGAELGGLLIAELLWCNPDIALSVLPDGQRVDHLHQAVIPEPLQLLADWSMKVGLVEPEHQQLDN